MDYNEEEEIGYGITPISGSAKLLSRTRDRSPACRNALHIYVHQLSCHRSAFVPQQVAHGPSRLLETVNT
jgi:hypothetical protein